ncbi:hypothetical protein [Paenibacillus aestuarii]|uniref:Uncharacterized protein n=1 Tax=Paenibacillus aestuarii TaxID=516965 RepID=A0ABW0KGY6_9BACL|nr:hypothetical protein [Paenibacillus aestuarii]
MRGAFQLLQLGEIGLQKHWSASKLLQMGKIELRHCSQGESCFAVRLRCANCTHSTYFPFFSRAQLP